MKLRCIGRVLPFLTCVLFLALFCPGKAFSGEMDTLLRILIEKKILTPQEAEIVREEAKKEAKKEEEKQRREIEEQVAKETEKAKEDVSEGIAAMLPKWLDKVTFGGDFRLRYRGDNWGNDGDSEWNSQARFRLRLNASADVTDDLEIGFGLASGGPNPRSTNQSFDSSFSTKDIRLDLAYAQFKPWASSTFLAGKFKMPIWIPQHSELLWDADVRPEGAAAKLGWDPFFLNTGVLFVDERLDADPMMIYVQPGLAMKFGDRFDLKVAPIGYYFVDVKGETLDFSAGTNTTSPDGGLTYTYSSVGGGFEFGYNKPLPLLPRIAFIGDSIYNPDPDDDNLGYLFGLVLGNRKVSERGQWKLVYMYRRLEKDAWVDVTPDADFRGGGTGAYGHEVIFQLGVFHNTTFGVDYYRTRTVSGPDDFQDVVQVDLDFTF